MICITKYYLLKFGALSGPVVVAMSILGPIPISWIIKESPERVVLIHRHTGRNLLFAELRKVRCYGEVGDVSQNFVPLKSKLKKRNVQKVRLNLHHD